MKYKIIENNSKKLVLSENYNYSFDKSDGKFCRWGKTACDEDDPSFSPIGPEILDWEISTICNMGCKWCYKSNTSVGKNIPFDDFKKTFEKIPKSVCQIAYGIGSINAFPDLFKILNYTRDRGIIPNITINGQATDEELEQLAMVCGAISVSHYSNDLCYDAITKLTELSKLDSATLRQVNIHQLLASETYDDCLSVINDIKNDERLKDLNAIVFLLLKPRGNRNTFTSVTYQQFANIISYGQQKKVSLGMDSCSAPMMIKYVSENNQKDILPSIEPCESSIFSGYFNVDCDYFPCSFSENIGEWEKGISVLNCEDFMNDVWFSEKVKKWRQNLIKSSSGCKCKVKNYCRLCPVFDITPCFKG